MRLIKIHLSQNSLCENNPTVIKEECGFSDEFMMFYDYCDNCGALFPQDKTVQQCQTPTCGSEIHLPGNRHRTSSFVRGDIVKQLKKVLEKEENIEVVRNRSARECKRNF